MQLLNYKTKQKLVLYNCITSEQFSITIFPLKFITKNFIQTNLSKKKKKPPEPDPVF